MSLPVPIILFIYVVYKNRSLRNPPPPINKIFLYFHSYSFLFLLCLFCLYIYQLSTSVLINLNKVDQFPNFAKFQKCTLFFCFLCQKLLYDSRSLGYSMTFGVTIISIRNVTLAIKFSDVASLHFNSCNQLLSWKMVKIDMSSQAVISADI